jgi:hypothetical protein
VGMVRHSPAAKLHTPAMPPPHLHDRPLQQAGCQLIWSIVCITAAGRHCRATGTACSHPGSHSLCAYPQGHDTLHAPGELQRLAFGVHARSDACMQCGAAQEGAAMHTTRGQGGAPACTCCMVQQRGCVYLPNTQWLLPLAHPPVLLPPTHLPRHPDTHTHSPTHSNTPAPHPHTRLTHPPSR